MRVQIPYTFQVVGVLPKKRSETTTYVGEYYHAEILELDDLEAPLATQWTEADGETVQTRWYEGSHWKIRRDKDKQLLSKQGLQDMLSSGLTEYNPIMDFSTSPKAKEFTSGELPVFSADNFKSIASSQQSAVLTKLDDLISDCIIVDDKVWVKSGEPYYRYNKHKFEHLPDGKIFIQPDIELTPKDTLTINWAHETFSAEQLDLFEERASGFDEVRVHDHHKIHVLLPEAIQYDADWNSLIVTARDFVEGAKKYLGSQTTDAVRYWADMSDMVKLAVENPSEENRDKLYHLAKACLQHSQEVLPTRLDEAADRWNNRNISLDFDVSNVF